MVPAGICMGAWAGAWWLEEAEELWGTSADAVSRPSEGGVSRTGREGWVTLVGVWADSGGAAGGAVRGSWSPGGAASGLGRNTLPAPTAVC